MSRIAELLRSRRMPQVAVLALMSVGFAGCSADMQTRFSDGTFSNPFASQPEATGSVRTPAVERREQPQYARPPVSAPQFQSQALPPPAAGAAPSAYPASSGGVSGGGRGISSYAPPSRSPIETTATVPPRSVAAARPSAPCLRRVAPAPRSSSAPATRSTFWPSATTFQPPRSCRPMATRARACCRPASN